MMKTKRNTAFIVELIAMFLVLLLVISVITTVSMKTRQQSIDAGRLTKAVVCAENVAEVTGEASGAKSCAEKLGSMDEAKNVAVSGSKVTADISVGNAEGAGADEFTVTIDVKTEDGKNGKYVTKDIAVYMPGEAGAAGDADAAGGSGAVESTDAAAGGSGAAENADADAAIYSLTSGHYVKEGAR